MEQILIAEVPEKLPDLVQENGRPPVAAVRPAKVKHEVNRIQFCCKETQIHIFAT